MAYMRKKRSDFWHDQASDPDELFEKIKGFGFANPIELGMGHKKPKFGLTDRLSTFSKSAN